MREKKGGRKEEEGTSRRPDAHSVNCNGASAVWLSDLFSVFLSLRRERKKKKREEKCRK